MVTRGYGSRGGAGGIQEASWRCVTGGTAGQHKKKMMLAGSSAAWGEHAALGTMCVCFDGLSAYMYKFETDLFGIDIGSRASPVRRNWRKTLRSTVFERLLRGSHKVKSQSGRSTVRDRLDLSTLPKTRQNKRCWAHKRCTNTKRAVCRNRRTLLHVDAVADCKARRMGSGSDSETTALETLLHLAEAGSRSQPQLLRHTTQP